MIAMALACTPALLIADEPTTALDVTIQAQILELMDDLKAKLSTAIILITHDLGVVAESAARVAVMYAGKVVEEAEAEPIFEAPLHPYTAGLLQSIPRIGRGRAPKGRLKEIRGAVPVPARLPPGCAFHPRCPQAMDVCRREAPRLTPAAGGHPVRCWLHA
jgi:oligopeptide/dipeptide ABC transporter ATP-binding protein